MSVEGLVSSLPLSLILLLLLLIIIKPSVAADLEFAPAQHVVDSCSTRASCNILIKCGWCNSRCHRAVTPGGRVVEVVVTIIRRALLTCTPTSRSTLPQLSPYLTIMSFKKDDEAGGICTYSLNGAAHTRSFLPR